MKPDDDGARLVYSDHLSGFFLMLVAGLGLVQSWHLPFGTISAPDAGFFPRCLCAILLLFGAAIIAQAFVTAGQPIRFGRRTWHVVIAAVILVLYAVTVQQIGYLIATFAVLLSLTRGLCGTSWARSLMIAVPGVILSWIAFSKLGVPLPTGILPF
jgi:hypothetical protein